MGLLTELMDRQETYKGILRQLREQEDKTFVEAIAAGEGLDEDAIVTVACILLELEEKEEGESRMPRENDLIWAIEFLDHLDTLGRKVVVK